MPVTDLAKGIGDSLLTGNNQPGLAGPLFSYPGANHVDYGGGRTSGPIVNSVGLQPAAPAAPRQPTAAETAAANKAASDAAAAAAINAGFGGVIANYDQQLSGIPGQIADAGAIVNSQADTQRGSVDSAYGRGVANLDYARNDLGVKTQRSIGDLAKSIRQSFDSYSTLIGAKGAGDSSATGQLSYALQKANAEGRTSIYQNQGDQLGQIAMKQGDLDAQHSDQIKQIDSWKSQQIITIGQQFKAAQQQIEAAKAGANKDKLLALASLSKDLVNQAVAALSGVEAQHNNTVANIQASLKSLSAPGDPAKLAATSFTATGAPVPIAPAISAGPAGGDTSGDSFSSVPYYKRLAAPAA